ncbi:MAG: hypothetical protein U0527_12870 [Candidatus Eisenbacteria bacterium]
MTGVVATHCDARTSYMVEAISPGVAAATTGIGASLFRPNTGHQQVGLLGLGR